MLWTVAIIMAVFWAMGLMMSVTVGGFIHILLFLAVIAIVSQLIQDRSV